MTARLIPIGLITFVFNLGGGLVAPALPLYARTLGADYRDLGLIGAAHGLAFALLTIPLGRASDRFGRRAILLLSTVGVGGSAALYLVAGHVAGLAAGKLLEAAAWAAFWPTLEAWVAERFGTRAGAAMGVAYGTSPERMAELLLGVAGKHAHVLAEPAPVVLFRGFGDSALLFEMRVWTGRFDDATQIQSELTVAAYAVLREAGIEIPFPQHDIRMRPA